VLGRNPFRVDGKEDATPDVTPELALKGDRWIFVNFYYPTPSRPKALNLLGELRRYESHGRHLEYRKTKKR